MNERQTNESTHTQNIHSANLFSFRWLHRWLLRLLEMQLMGNVSEYFCSVEVNNCPTKVNTKRSANNTTKRYSSDAFYRYQTVFLSDATSFCFKRAQYLLYFFWILSYFFWILFISLDSFLLRWILTKTQLNQLTAKCFHHWAHRLCICSKNGFFYGVIPTYVRVDGVKY